MSLTVSAKFIGTSSITIKIIVLFASIDVFTYGRFYAFAIVFKFFQVLSEIWPIENYIMKIQFTVY